MWPIFQKPGVFVAHPDFADAAQFAQRLKANKIGWVAVQVHNGGIEVNRDWLDVHGWPAIMRAAGIRFGVWGYLGTDPAGDAALASALIGHYDDAAHSCFYIADAEAEYKGDTGGNKARSGQFVSAFRQLRPTRPAALSSYGAASWDNLLGTVFDYAPWQSNSFDFMPQAYFNQAAEYAPNHCVKQAVANGWATADVHPTVGIYTDSLGRINGDQYSYLLRDLPTTGWSVFNGENLTDADLAALARLV